MHRIITLGLAAITVAGSLGSGGCSPPALEITAPAARSWHIVWSDGGTVTVQGQLHGAETSSATVRLWWDHVGQPSDAVIASLNPSTGAFTASMVLPSGPYDAIKVVVAEARYGPGGSQVLRDAVEFFWAPTPDYQAGGRTESAILRVNDSGIDHMEAYVSHEASNQIDLASLVSTGDLLNGAEPCAVTGPLGTCIVRVLSLRYWGGTIGDGPGGSDDVHVFLDAQSNLIHTDILVDRVDVTIRYNGRVFGLNTTCDFAIQAAPFWVNSAYALHDDPNNPAHVRVEQIGFVNVDLSSAVVQDIDCAGLIGGAMGSFVQWVAGEPSVKGGVETALESEFNGNGKPIAVALDSALHDLQLAQTVGAALGVDLNPEITEVPEDADGVTVVAGIFATPSGTRCDPGAPYEAYPELCPSFGGHTYAVPALAPALGATIPTPAAQPYDLAVALSDAAFGSLFAAMSSQGLFSGRVTDMEMCQRYGPDGEPFGDTRLTYQCLFGNDPFLCDLLQVNCQDVLQILFHPALPLAVRGGASDLGAMAHLDALLKVVVLTDRARQGDFPPGTPDKRVLTIFVDFEAGMDLVTANVGGEPHLALDVFLCRPDEPGMSCTPRVEATTVKSNFPGGNGFFIGPNLIDHLMGDAGLISDTIASALDDAVRTFPLPTVQGTSIVPITTMRRGGLTGHLILFAELVP